ncbi:MAG: histidine kinase, partial [Acidobacteria bacterium]|nr:histidine kinase [Acidobacteriota bacterium]
ARAERDALGLARIARHVVSTDHALVDMLVDIVDLFDLRGAQLHRRGEEEPWVHAGEVGETPTVLSLGDDYELRVDGPSLAGSRRDLLVAISAQIVAALDRRRLEDEAAQRRTLADAERLRAGLLAAVSHDLRTPLASIKTAATTLLDAGDRIPVEDAHSLLGDIDAQADHLNRLVGDLLDVARVNEGTIELD